MTSTLRGSQAGERPRQRHPWDSTLHESRLKPPSLRLIVRSVLVRRSGARGSAVPELLTNTARRHRASWPQYIQIPQEGKTDTPSRQRSRVRVPQSAPKIRKIQVDSAALAHLASPDLCHLTHRWTAPLK